jgi:hypothetical protein
MASVATLVFILLQTSLASAVLRPHEQLTASQLRERALGVETVRYSNDWAVQIQGDLETVNAIASSREFINMGQVLISAIIDRGERGIESAHCIILVHGVCYA